ncbi:MAG TPA: PQQ-binding-like beta-propeller repeat protein [Pyrinomonadaceae bacterium]|nr:PQQ-binding-like beta-propeller repeat protein [Pyrinomonadaceae bacterium]
MRSPLLKCLVVIAISITASRVAPADWPQWRGPNRDGLVKGVANPATWPKTLKEEWKIMVGVGHASPVEANGKIYVFARQGEAEVLLCLNAVTGKEIWKSVPQPISYEMHEAAKGHGKGPKATPIVSNGIVYTFGISGVLSAYDANTGKLKWQREFSKDYPKTSPLFGTSMSPLVDSGLVIAHVGGHDKGALTAFDAQTGATKWSNAMDGPAYASPIIVNLAGARQIVTFMQKDLVGVDFATGKLLWKLPSKTRYDENINTVVTYKDMLIFSREEQGLAAIRLTKPAAEIVPQEVWVNKAAELYMNSPVLQGNTLYGMTARQKGQFFAVDAETGKTVWQSPGRMGENAAILNLSDKVILLLTNDAKLIVQAADGKTYSPLAEYTVAASPTWAHPLVLGRRILIKDENSLTSWAVAP